MTKKKLSFEEALTELENIVTEMETSSPDLNTLIKKYTRGIELSQKCLQELEIAEKAMDYVIDPNFHTQNELKLEKKGE